MTFGVHYYDKNGLEITGARYWQITVEKRDLQIAQLQEQVKALAAENCIQDFIIAAVKDLVRDSEGVIGWNLNGDVATWDEVLPELDHSETPATDALVADIHNAVIDEAIQAMVTSGAQLFGDCVVAVGNLRKQGGE